MGDNANTGKRQLSYFPFSYTQRIREPVDCTGALLLIELSSTLFSAWACSFSQHIGLQDHTTLFALFLDVIERCCETRTSFFMETVLIHTLFIL